MSTDDESTAPAETPAENPPIDTAGVKPIRPQQAIIASTHRAITVLAFVMGGLTLTQFYNLLIQCKWFVDWYLETDELPRLEDLLFQIVFPSIVFVATTIMCYFLGRLWFTSRRATREGRCTVTRVLLSETKVWWCWAVTMTFCAIFLAARYYYLTRMLSDPID